MALLYKIKIVDKLHNKFEEDKDVEGDPRSRMWKQVIRENVIEDKKNELENLLEKTDKIEKIVVEKLREVDNQAKEGQRKVMQKSDTIEQIVVKKLKEIDDETKKGQMKMIRKTESIEKLVLEKFEEIDEQTKEGQRLVVQQLHEIDFKANWDYEMRKNELQNMMKDFKTFIKEAKGQETKDRSMEVERTLHFMGNLGKQDEVLYRLPLLLRSELIKLRET